MSLRDKIQAAEDRPSEVVAVPEWDVDVCVRGLSAAASERFAMRVGPDADDTPSVMAELVVMTAEEPDTGEPVFEPEDVAWVAEKSGAALRRVFEVAQRLSGLGELDEAKKD